MAKPNPKKKDAGTSLGADAWRRLKQNRLAMVSLIIIAAITFVGYTASLIWAPHVTHFSATEQNQPLANRPPGTRAISVTYPTYDGDKAGFSVIDLDNDGVIACQRTQWADGTPGPLECPELRLITIAARFHDDLFADYDRASGDEEPAPGALNGDGYLTFREYPKDDLEVPAQFRGLGLTGPEAFRKLDIDGDHVVSRWEVVERSRYLRYTSLEKSGARSYEPFILNHDKDKDLRLTLAEYPGAPELHTFVLGTDNAGRDILTRLIYGARLSITIGLLSTLVSLLIGVLYGAIAGYAGGRVDNVMMRIVDILYGLPFMFLVILIMAIVQDRDDPVTVFILLGCVQWLTTARVVRGQVLSLKNREFIEAQRALGAGRLNIVLKHLIPNALGPVIVYATLLVPAVILEEAFLSFLGLGLSDSWGKMISEGANITSLQAFPWQIVFPGAALAVTLFALNFLGDGVRDAMDPQLRGKK
ncbi:MAG TPA: ABC transporter permease [Myxococcota bacterium]|nr:ABC transporter permease [Myxococcota bacterium]